MGWGGRKESQAPSIFTQSSTSPRQPCLHLILGDVRPWCLSPIVTAHSSACVATCLDIYDGAMPLHQLNVSVAFNKYLLNTILIPCHQVANHDQDSIPALLELKGQ